MFYNHIHVWPGVDQSGHTPDTDPDKNLILTYAMRSKCRGGADCHHIEGATGTYAQVMDVMDEWCTKNLELTGESRGVSQRAERDAQSALESEERLLGDHEARGGACDSFRCNESGWRPRDGRLLRAPIGPTNVRDCRDLWWVDPEPGGDGVKYACRNPSKKGSSERPNSGGRCKQAGTGVFGIRPADADSNGRVLYIPPGAAAGPGPAAPAAAGAAGPAGPAAAGPGPAPAAAGPGPGPAAAGLKIKSSIKKPAKIRRKEGKK